jgi:hypothetical protein
MMPTLKDISLFVVGAAIFGSFVTAMALYTQPNVVCVDNQLYELKKDYAVSLNKQCLPVDKD